MDAMMAIAGTLLFSICAALGIEWVFLAGAFRFMSGALITTTSTTNTTRTPVPQRLSQAPGTEPRGPALWR